MQSQQPLLPWALGEGRVTPGRVTPGRVTPGRVTPGRVTPGRVTPGRVTPGRVCDLVTFEMWKMSTSGPKNTNVKTPRKPKKRQRSSGWCNGEGGDKLKRGREQREGRGG